MTTHDEPPGAGSADPHLEELRLIRFGLWTSAASAIGAILAVAVAVWAATNSDRLASDALAAARRHDELSVQPRVSFAVWFAASRERIGVAMANDGLGPAEIREIRYFVDGEEIALPGRRGCVEVAKRLDLQGAYYCGFVKRDTFLRAGEEIFLLGSDGPPEKRHFVELEKKLPRFGVDVCYCSLYGHCWQHNFGPHSPSKTCPTAEVDASRETANDRAGGVGAD